MPAGLFATFRRCLPAPLLRLVVVDQIGVRDEIACGFLPRSPLRCPLIGCDLDWRAAIQALSGSVSIEVLVPILVGSEAAVEVMGVMASTMKFSCRGRQPRPSGDILWLSGKTQGEEAVS